ncbi:MAG: hypothetical protein B6241_13920 [Spirochaetaceae bacterium 4572_59]|nr:MAG: hypothetical protein B6241_13920 [Spirochaetaceae bacterium 4572_59]
MNKQELVRELATRLSLSQKNVKHLVETTLEEITLIMEEDESYSQTGFGSFKAEVKNERITYNPAYRKKMLLPKKKKVHFRPSTILKGKINE